MNTTHLDELKAKLVEKSVEPYWLALGMNKEQAG